MTGSKAQLYNGIALLFTFFSCRLVWGTYQSAVVYKDMWRAVHAAPTEEYLAPYANATAMAVGPDGNVMYFVSGGVDPVPIWLALLYVGSNLTLNGLNWVWFFKMITAVRKRFDPPKAAAKGNVIAQGQTTGAVDKKSGQAELRNRRRNSIEDVIPDSEELREGTIQ